VISVIGKEESGPRWSIGQLAQASGLTVRALRHYDAVGLLKASERTASGHRRYTEADLRRLYRVRALRSLGL
jgi:MerR family transcriptional regulator, thiopeptide resistance regulator